MSPLKLDGQRIVYECGQCGASNVKLWRHYQTFLEAQELFCAPCAGAQQGIDVSRLDRDGRRESELGMRTDQIGWLIPAVPTDDETTFWGYTSVPPERVAWWRGLPNG